LISNYKDHLEAHIKPNLLIIWYEIEGDTIKLVRVGSHAKLFGK
ncbi:MAG: type II toxin-antitoxin system mRNA interferase toxin, RelE/StbE family, partial [Bacteroidales bacterium]|nr:type II toxin-antitoxin system mRNA interferase toxin, RelE/StbE family [Bacteroidales bacterium]